MQNLKFFRYLAYSIEILVFFVLGSTPSLFPEIFGATPCLLVALAITIAVFESEVPAMIFGVICGALTDLGFSNSIGDRLCSGPIKRCLSVLLKTRISDKKSVFQIRNADFLMSSVFYWDFVLTISSPQIFTT